MVKISAQNPSKDSTVQWQQAVSQLGRAMASKLSLDAIFREFLMGIKDFVPHDHVVISRVDIEKKIFPLFFHSTISKETLAASRPTYDRGGTATEWTVRERKPFIREDTALEKDFETDHSFNRMGLRSYITVPLIYWDRVVGSFCVASKDPKVYGQKELGFLLSVSEWLAIAMENARLFQETHRLYEEQGVMHHIISQIQVLDLDTLLQRLTDEVNSIFKSDCVFVRLREPDGKYHLRASSGAALSLQAQSSLEGRGRSSWILKNRKPLFIRDLSSQDPSIPKGENLDKLGFRSYLGVPIMLRQEAIGVLVVLSKSIKEFTERDSFFLQQFAVEAAVAIEHARLFDELKRLNQSLKEATDNKTNFLARMSHDLRTPLAVIFGLLDVLESDTYGPVNREQKEALEKIRRQCNGLLTLVNTVLHISRIEAGAIPLEVSTFSLDRIIDSWEMLVAEYKRRTGLKVIWEIDQKLPSLTTDPGKLEQVIQNLIVNAFKYTSQGEVRIRIKNDPETSHVKFVVEDTGKGISREDFNRIFNSFEQVQSTATGQGVGLGLAIVKKYLDLMKGTIEVQSEVGKGSVFTVFLPYSIEA